MELLFAFITSLLYDDIRAYLEIQHPGSLIYALIAKIVIVYGSLAFVLWQFRPRAAASGAAGRETPVFPFLLNRFEPDVTNIL
mgnify:CR=1 FL=1